MRAALTTRAESNRRSVLQGGQLGWAWNILPPIRADHALFGGAEGAAAVAGEGGVGGALHLKRLHAREEVEELRGERVGVEAGFF